MKSLRSLALALAVLVPLSLSPGALAANMLPGIGAVTYDEASNSLTLAIPYQGRNPYRVLWLNGRERLVVDIEGLHTITTKRSLFIGGGVVTQIRAARFARNVTRVVFDLAQSADLRTVTDGSSNTLLLTVYPRGSEPVSLGTSVAIAPTPQAVPTHRPTARRTPSPAPRPTTTPTPIPVMTPEGRITPVPVFTPSSVPTPVPTPMPTELPTPEPTFVPTPPTGTIETSPEPQLPSGPEQTGIVAPEFQVFGSRVYAGADLPLSFSESYPAGGSTSAVAGPLVGGVFGWDHMFTSNFGLSLAGHGVSYTIADQAAADAGITLQHRRDEYDGGLGLRGRFGLPFGLELMAQPGFMLRMAQVKSFTLDANKAQTPAAASQYLYSGWLGYGPYATGGLGWHVWGPLSLVGTGEFDYLLGGSMSQAGVTPIFPMMGLKFGGEARLEFGNFGFSAGYNLTNYTFNGGSSDNTLAQSFSGPVVKLNFIY